MRKGRCSSARPAFRALVNGVEVSDLRDYNDATMCIFEAFFKDIECVASFGDDEILDFAKRYRSRGFHAYILPQPPGLPFGHTREDLLIVRP